MATRTQFNEDESCAVLSIKSVGQTVTQRFEKITKKVASMLNTTCWKKSPQAKNAINAAINIAKANG